MEELAQRLASQVIRACRLYNATHKYLLNAFWDVWVGEHELGTSLEEALGDLADEIEWEIEIDILSHDEADELYERILQITSNNNPIKEYKE